ncbi:carboxypeptidase-like regulatory domain-containing protein [Hymenobacter lutimineralis]|uniref:Carboxypeptidase-like regulatory domain-containing protein n=1 Tax=Hymenobacter lutimineralis TaxID=2606448 RepID=A0A5D6UZ20_9BACT|nr:hypothetical protein [Hymenobacter lutimineralis]TYZ08843.1 carboxypeptidase-like regulatory domain-containing protein [Hymenobacter lutimineralis]
MTPTAGGRHCAACEKTVVDFTSLTSEQLLAALHQPEKVCGRFRPDQLHAPALPASRAARNWTQWVAAAAITLSSCGTPDALPLQLRTSPVTVDGNYVLVRGKVVDKTDGRPLPDALIISLADTSFRTTSDSTGHFTLKLPQQLRDSLLYAVGHTSPQGYTQGYIGRRLRPEQTAEIRLRPDPNAGVLGEPAPVTLEAGEMRYPLRLLAPPPPPPRLSTVQFPAAESAGPTEDSVEVFEAP